MRFRLGQRDDGTTRRRHDDMTVMDYFMVRTPMARLAVTVRGEAVTGIKLNARARRAPRTAFERRVARELREYAAGRRRRFTFRVEAMGTAFERQVWRELRRIPYGETATYGEIARRVGRPGAARAVGAANGRNPIPIVVPCHRVVAAGGKLGGYGGGLALKRRLLDLEASGRSGS